SSSTPTTATRSFRSHTSGSSRRACSSGARRSRTSSCVSPGARSSTDGLRASRLRVLDAHVPARLSRHARVEHPEPRSLPDGARGRSRHGREQGRAPARRPVSHVRRARPPRRGRDAGVDDRGGLARARGDPLDAPVLRDARDAASHRRPDRRPSAVRRDTRRHERRDLPRRDRRVRRRALRVGAACVARVRPDRARVRRSRLRAVRVRGARAVQPADAVRDHADVPLLGDVLPGHAATARAARARVRDAALARGRPDPALHPRDTDARGGGRACRLPPVVDRRRRLARTARLPKAARAVTAIALRTRGHLLFERNLFVYRHAWMTIFSGFFEPLFYLFSFGLGLGHFVGRIHGVSYASYIAPALLASSAMNGAINDAMTNVFWKLRYAKVYESMLSTPLGPADVAVGETSWAQFRSLTYSCGF